MPAVPISVVIITLDEERDLGRCLDSVAGVADDVVVVDSGSTDRTEAIARERGARFVFHRFEGYIEQKNWAIAQAKHPHVLSLDADEALDDELRRAILAVKADFRCDGYSMNRLSNYCGHWVRHSGWYPDRKLRLWDSRKGRWGGVNPHDRFELEPGSTTAHLAGDILHYGYYTRDDHLRQADLFTTIAAQALFARGKRAPWFKRWGSPVFTFLRDYLLRLGVLDGRAGLQICWISACATAAKYRKLRALSR